MHVLTPQWPTTDAQPVFLDNGARATADKYLTDESRRGGRADAICFPRSTDEVVAAVRTACDHDLAITVSAARTGIAAGAVPDGGMLLSLERMNRVLGARALPGSSDILVEMEAGVPLSDLQEGLRTGSFVDSSGWTPDAQAVLEQMRSRRLFYPPDPTETGAAIGGTVACNASGAHTFLYGPTRPYVEGICVVLADGGVLRLSRGQARADADGGFALQRPDGARVPGRVPRYAWPDTKNSAGYYAAPGMDLIDLIIGSEGTLGIITEVTVRVVPAPETSCAVMTFWPSEASALAFTRALRRCRAEWGVEAIEYVGPGAMAMLRDRRETFGAASGVPACLPAAAACGIYLDLGLAAAALRDALAGIADLVRTGGGDPELCWTAMARDERERLRVFRHALPETVNATIAETRRVHPEITKLGTDMAVPDACLESVIRLYRERLDDEGLHYVIFGHIGNNHLHVNILPRTPEEYRTGWDLYHEFARQVVGMGGSPAAEHGIGKLKTDFLEILFGPQGIADMRAVKAVFDPEARLGRGTLFPPKESTA